jgi:hypothetical protein
MAITHLGPRRFLLTTSLVFFADTIADVLQTSETGLQRVLDDQLVKACESLQTLFVKPQRQVPCGNLPNFKDHDKLSVLVPSTVPQS